MHSIHLFFTFIYLLLLYYRKLGDKNRAKLLSYALGLLDSESR